MIAGCREGCEPRRARSATAPATPRTGRRHDRWRQVGSPTATRRPGRRRSGRRPKDEASQSTSSWSVSGVRRDGRDGFRVAGGRYGLIGGRAASVGSGVPVVAGRHVAAGGADGCPRGERLGPTADRLRVVGWNAALHVPRSCTPQPSTTRAAGCSTNPRPSDGSTSTVVDGSAARTTRKPTRHTATASE